MEPPMSNGSMHHREPKSEIDGTGQILQGASCTIAARARDEVEREQQRSTMHCSVRLPVLESVIKYRTLVVIIILR
jgi:hypothetical protein